jgi:hypothetical protein
LKSTRISQQRPIPADESVKTARSFDYVNTGSQPEMIRVAENDSGVKLGFKGFEANAFDSSGSADRHEDGSLDLCATSGQHTRTRLAGSGVDLKMEWVHENISRKAAKFMQRRKETFVPLF